MAPFYTMTLRGTLKSLNWAMNLHFRAESVDVGLTERDICHGLAQLGYEFWDELCQIVVTNRTVLTKVVATAWGDPEGFYEQPAALIGTLTGAITAEFNAKGFRLFRSNQDFRTSTHRFPEVREDNNNDGVWISDPAIPDSAISAIVNWLASPHSIEVPPTILTVDFVPVLIRSQVTVTDPITGVKNTTYFDPPETSDVADAGFYGITSQVSRKYILPA